MLLPSRRRAACVHMGKPELACLRSLSSFTSQLPQPVEHSGICKICSHIIQFSHTTKKKSNLIDKVQMRNS
ncbi:hypothetical protein [Oryza sativa Japonica Group]|uniref:Uncharacterized protein P0674H09.4 n=1 Tax=Oryza sativa subsp. japonica TaxID=39947 RepID=Q5N8N7_ORYSJ|nr:hypothetical protein [Oryza sativa Japonica Group]